MTDYTTCQGCGGLGEYHDCGEDTCCCLNPEASDMWECHECEGHGVVLAHAFDDYGQAPEGET